ncbi:hypothetical protein FACS1894181_18520 [Bacteroidia bacterium]|nr:hypothetical protein FACS1894181_18520 [Bacteroidia bacterium]
MKKRNAQTISEALNEFLAGNDSLRERLLIIRIQRAWGEVLGPSILQYTRNIYVKNRVLHVFLTSSVVRNELLLSREQLVKSLNDYVGAEVITDIAIR